MKSHSSFTYIEQALAVKSQQSDIRMIRPRQAPHAAAYYRPIGPIGTRSDLPDITLSAPPSQSAERRASVRTDGRLISAIGRRDDVIWQPCESGLPNRPHG